MLICCAVESIFRKFRALPQTYSGAEVCFLILNVTDMFTVDLPSTVNRIFLYVTHKFENFDKYSLINRTAC